VIFLLYFTAITPLYTTQPDLWYSSYIRWLVPLSHSFFFTLVCGCYREFSTKPAPFLLGRSSPWTYRNTHTRLSLSAVPENCITIAPYLITGVPRPPNAELPVMPIMQLALESQSTISTHEPIFSWACSRPHPCPLELLRAHHTILLVSSLTKNRWKRAWSSAHSGDRFCQPMPVRDAYCLGLKSRDFNSSNKPLAECLDRWLAL
jgi:hypothetical protein